MHVNVPVNDINLKIDEVLRQDRSRSRSRSSSRERPLGLHWCRDLTREPDREREPERLINCLKFNMKKRGLPRPTYGARNNLYNIIVEINLISTAKQPSLPASS